MLIRNLLSQLEQGQKGEIELEKYFTWEANLARIVSELRTSNRVQNADLVVGNAQRYQNRSVFLRILLTDSELCVFLKFFNSS